MLLFSFLQSSYNLRARVSTKVKLRSNKSLDNNSHNPTV